MEYIRNAGSTSDGLQLLDTGTGVSISYKDGSECVTNGNTVNYTTSLDFLCTQNEDKLDYVGNVDTCTSQLFWQTSLACLPGQLETRETGNCVLDIPGYDVRLDLAAWSHDHYYTARSETGDQRWFQLNLCSSVKEGLCHNNAVVCEVNDEFQV